MAKTKQSLIKQIFFLLLAVLLVKCANQMSPEGGEVDKLPPTIIESYPENGTTNFSENTLEFSFSEYVNKRNMTEAFFASPLLEKNPEFSWTGRTVYVEFQETLKENTTYSIAIGTEMTDVNNNNKMKEPYILTFSTGAKIDSGRISGKVFGDKIDGTMIFAYRIDTGSVDIYNQKPSFVSQIDENGKFDLSGIGNGQYDIFAVKDEFKDLVYNIGSDKIGFTNSFVELSDTQKFIENKKFFTFLEDTLAPAIQSVTMTDKNHIVLEFTEPIDSTRLSTSNFLIQDSTRNLTYNLNYIFPSPKKNIEYILCLSDSLDIESELYLISTNIFDKNDNLLLEQSSNFVGSDKPDTNEIILNKVLTKFSKSTIDFKNPEFSLQFSDGFDTTKISNQIKLFDKDSLEIPIRFEFPNSANIRVNSKEKLKEKSEYTLSIEMNQFVDAAGNLIDTIFTRKINTISDLEFSGASGVIKANNNKVDVILRELGKQQNSIKTTADKNSFTFDRIIPGKYLLWAYIDSDSNDLYSNGSIEPKTYAEDFIFYPDTLNLRARWPIGDIELNFTNKNN